MDILCQENTQQISYIICGPPLAQCGLAPIGPVFFFQISFSPFGSIWALLGPFIYLGHVGPIDLFATVSRILWVWDPADVHQAESLKPVQNQSGERFGCEENCCPPGRVSTCPVLLVCARLQTNTSPEKDVSDWSTSFQINTSPKQNRFRLV